jgi:CheY-like chemotaxis protein
VPSLPSLARRPQAAHPLRILYADDLRELREFMSVMLARQGHLIETVADGSSALEWLQRAGAAVDLLITDHNMHEGMDGIELVRRVRESTFAGKIVVFTSELSEAVLDQYHGLGVDLILPKSTFPVALRRMLDDLFNPPDLPGADEVAPVI